MQLPDFSVGYGTEVEETSWSSVVLVYGLMLAVVVAGAYFLWRRKAGKK